MARGTDEGQRIARASIPGVLLAAMGTAGADPAERVYPAVLLREGVFTPGLGNPLGLRFLFPAATLAAMAASGEGKRVDLNHRMTTEDEVGVLRNPHMDGDGVRLRADLALQPVRPKFKEAYGFVEGRLAAKQVPNVSVEVIDIITQPAEPGSTYNGQPYDAVIVSAVLDGCAILPVGACSDKDGCGIGLASHIPVLAFSAPTGADGQNANPHQETHNMDDKNKGTPGAPASCGCGGKAPDVASLQARVAELTTALEAKTSEAASLAEKVQGYEAAEVQALREAVQAAAPSGTELAAIVGKEPTKEVLSAALAAFQAAKPKDLGLQAGGRKTAPASRDQKDAAAAAPNPDHLTAMRAKLGLKEKPSSKMPASLQRNTARVLTAAEGAASGQ